MAEEIVINGEDLHHEEFHDIDSNTNRVSDLATKLESLEFQKVELAQERDEFKDKYTKVTVEVEGLKKEKEASCKEKEEFKKKLDESIAEIEGLKTEKEKVASERDEFKEKLDNLMVEIEGLKADKDKMAEENESDKKTLESIATRAADLETEVARMQHDLISAMNEGKEANTEVVALKRVLEEKVANLEWLEKEKEALKNGFAKEIEEVKRAKAVIEAKVSELESKTNGIGEGANVKVSEMEKEISELKRQKEELEAALSKNALELEKSRGEKREMVEALKVSAGNIKELEKSRADKKLIEEALRVSEARVKELERKLIELEKGAGEAEKVISGLKEKTSGAVNEASNFADKTVLVGNDRELNGAKNSQLPALVAAAGTSFLVGGAVCFLIYGRQR